MKNNQSVSLEEIESLLVKSQELYNSRDFTQAIKLADDALLSITLLKTDEKTIDNLYIRAYYRKAKCSYDTQHYGESLVDSKTALTYAQRTENLQRVAIILIHISLSHLQTSEFSIAISQAEEALSICEELDDKPNLAKAYSTIAWGNLQLSNYQKSLEYFNKALAISEQLQNEGEVAGALHNIAVVQMELGEYVSAFDLLNRALEINRRIGNKLWERNNLSQLGTIAKDQLKDYPMAMNYYEQTLEIDEEMGSTHAVILDNIGTLCRRLKDYPRALEYLEKSYAIANKTNNKLQVATTLGNIGNVHSDMSDINLAIDYYQQAANIYEKVNNKNGLAMILGNIGSRYLDIENYQKALEYLTTAYKLHEEIGTNNKFDHCLKLLGVLYSKADFEFHDYAKAEEYLLRSLALSEEFGSKDYSIHGALASLYEEQQNYELFAKHLKQHVKILEEVEHENARIAHQRLIIRDAEFKKQQMELEMKLTREELSNKALQLVQQTEMIQNFREELDGIVHHADTAEKALRSIREKVKELPENVMNWNRFEEDFKNVHPQFQNKLKERYPQLTTTEIKICCLLRLGMKSHEIGTLLFLSERTVENHRYNLRKKLNVTESQTLYDILEKV